MIDQYKDPFAHELLVGLEKEAPGVRWTMDPVSGQDAVHIAAHVQHTDGELTIAHTFDLTMDRPMGVWFSLEFVIKEFAVKIGEAIMQPHTWTLERLAAETGEGE